MMSMKLFTLSAVCMLVLCMLLALSGTTDFPGHDPEFASGAPLLDPPRGAPTGSSGLDLTFRDPVSQERGSEAHPPRPIETSNATSRNGPLFLFGLLMLLGWVVLGLKFFSSD